MTAEQKQGTGDCYEVAGRLVALDERFDGLVCHGTAIGRGPIAGEPFGHAWIEGDLNGVPTVYDFSNGLNVIVDRDIYYQMGGIDPATVRKYTAREACNEMLRTGHFGPWEDDDECHA